MLVVELGGLRPDARGGAHLAACLQVLTDVTRSIHGRRARIPTSWEGEELGGPQDPPQEHSPTLPWPRGGLSMGGSEETQVDLTAWGPE
jgi:hypothetical protein